jgi:hypothetical protein
MKITYASKRLRGQRKRCLWNIRGCKLVLVHSKLTEISGKRERVTCFTSPLTRPYRFRLGRLWTLTARSDAASNSQHRHFLSRHSVLCLSVCLTDRIFFQDPGLCCNTTTGPSLAATIERSLCPCLHRTLPANRLDPRRRIQIRMEYVK